MAMERTHNDPITFEIAEHLTVISKKDNGWCRELNLVSWNGQQPPKFDIRDWSPDHTKMSRGITLFDNEMRKVSQAYIRFCNARKVSEERNNRNAAAEAGIRVGEEAARAQQEAEEEADTADMRAREEARTQQESEAQAYEQPVPDDFESTGVNDSAIAS